jgi:hypothetical protein
MEFYSNYSPRAAAVEIVRLINDPNQQVSVLALGVSKWDLRYLLNHIAADTSCWIFASRIVDIHFIYRYRARNF